MKKLIISALFAAGLVAGVEAAPADAVTQADLQTILERLNKLEAENKAQAKKIAELEGRNRGTRRQAVRDREEGRDRRRRAEAGRWRGEGRQDDRSLGLRQDLHDRERQEILSRGRDGEDLRAALRVRAADHALRLSRPGGRLLRPRA